MRSTCQQEELKSSRNEETIMYANEATKTPILLWASVNSIRFLTGFSANLTGVDLIEKNILSYCYTLIFKCLNLQHLFKCLLEFLLLEWLKKIGLMIRITLLYKHLMSNQTSVLRTNWKWIRLKWIQLSSWILTVLTTVYVTWFGSQTNALKSSAAIKISIWKVFDLRGNFLFKKKSV